jgi:hypothetical protein
MLSMKRALAIALLCAACGGDDGGGGGSGSGEPQDAPTGSMSDGAATGDGQGAGTQGPGQFCEVTPQGPYCQAGLTCCMSDKICRIATDCPGSTGFIMCVKLADCPNGNVCCQTPAQTFCTKKSACDSYGGTELP